jgi:hypothetical protein
MRSVSWQLQKTNFNGAKDFLIVLSLHGHRISIPAYAIEQQW